MSSNIQRIDIKYWAKWLICFIIPVVILLLPTNDLFTVILKKFVAVTVFGILMFLLEVMPNPIIAMTWAFAYPVLGVCKVNEVVAPWALTVVMQIILSLLIVEAVNNTPIMERLAAYMLKTRLGNSYFGILCVFAIFTTAVSILVPGMGMGIIHIMLALSLIRAMGYKANDNIACGLMMISVYGMTTAQNFLYSPSGNGTAAAMISTVIDGYQLGYVQIIIENLIFIPQMLAICFLFTRIYGAKIHQTDFAKNKLKELGPLTKAEKRIIIILCAMVIFLVSTQFSGMDMTLGFVGAVILLYFPALGIADKDVFCRTNFSVPFIAAFCMCIGTIAMTAGADKAFNALAAPLFQEVNNSFVFVGATWLLGFVSNIFMTPATLMTLFCPLLAPLAEMLGYSANVVAYVLYHAGNAVIFPYENGTLLVMYSFGILSMRNFIKGALAISILDIIWLLVLGVPYWILIGLL